MKKIISIVSLVFICMMSLHYTQAQEGYTYTLISNGTYSFTVGAVPNTSTSNFATSVQSYGFTIILPDGVTATFSSSLGGAADATFFDGSAVGQAAIDGYLVTETLGSPASLPAPSSGTTTNMITIAVQGNPETGEISILANNSVLANAETPLKSFMQADMVDDGSAVFVNVVDSNASGLSGDTSFSFEPLGVRELELTDISIYPNPASEFITIKSTVTIDTIELFDMLGKRVLQTTKTDKIKVDLLPAGLYLLKVYAQNSSLTKRVVIN